MDEEEVVLIKVYNKEKGDVVFEGNVSSDVEPNELVKLGCFWGRSLCAIYNKATNEQLKSFKGLQSNVELVAGGGSSKHFSGALYVEANDKVLRKSESVPSCESVMMTVWRLSHKECEKAFKCETLEELAIHECGLELIPKDVGKMKNLKKLRLEGLQELKSAPEEIGELSSLKELRIGWCGVEILQMRLKKLKSVTLVGLSELKLNAEDLGVISKLKHLTIKNCRNVFTPSFAESFWEMIKSSTDLRVLDLVWFHQNRELVEAALKENGSIVDGGLGSESFAHIFNRNKQNHERALQCVMQLLAIRRWRNALNDAPRELVQMIAIMFWATRCDAGAWTKKAN